MKKFTAIILTAAMALTFAGCSEDGGATLSVETKPSETTAAAGKVSTKDNDATKATTQKTAAATSFDPLGNFDKTAAIEPTVLYDNGGVKITAESLEFSNRYMSLSILVENSGSEDVSVRTESCCINGYMASGGFMSCDVAPGKKSRETPDFSIDGLMLRGITAVAEIGYTFELTFGDSWDKTYTDPIVVETSLAGSHNYSKENFSDTVDDDAMLAYLEYTVDDFIDEDHVVNDYITIKCSALLSNSDGDKILYIDMENTSDRQIRAAESGIAVNGLTIESGRWTSDTIAPGKRALAELNLNSMMDASYWEIYGLDNIAEITWTISTEDMNYDEIVPETTLTLTLDENGAVDNSGTEVYNANGIRIVYKGIFEDEWEYSDTLHIMLLIENNSSQTITVDDDYGTFSINGFMTTVSVYSSTIGPGESAVNDISLYSWDLESADVTGIEDITEFEMTLRIRDNNYKEIARPTITVTP